MTFGHKAYPVHPFRLGSPVTAPPDNNLITANTTDIAADRLAGVESGGEVLTLSSWHRV